MTTNSDTPQPQRITAVSPDWPRDPHAFTSSLRRELARAIGRIKGNPEKQAIFEEHLKAAAVWGRDRFRVQAEIKKRAFDEAVARNAELDRQQSEQAEKLASGELKQETAGERATRQANSGVGTPVASGVKVAKG